MDTRTTRTRYGALLLWVGGCAAGPGDDGLYGERPLETVPAPTFVATNRDGAPRDREALLGAPTAMWFYPAAATSG